MTTSTSTTATSPSNFYGVEDKGRFQWQRRTTRSRLTCRFLAIVVGQPGTLWHASLQRWKLNFTYFCVSSQCFGAPHRMLERQYFSDVKDPWKKPRIPEVEADVPVRNHYFFIHCGTDCTLHCLGDWSTSSAITWMLQMRRPCSAISECCSFDNERSTFTFSQWLP